MNSKQRRGLGLALVVAILAVSYQLSPQPLAFDARGLSNLPSIFGYLIMLSLIVERAIEVLLSAWRSAGADKLDGEIEQLAERLSTLPEDCGDGSASGDERQQLSEQLRAVKCQRALYRVHSRQISQWLGMGIGVLLGLVGVRVLGNMVSVVEVSDLQARLFVVVDVLITGAVLAGGSESVNRIMKLYNRFMDATAQRTKA
ncbi:hypothetical protein [Aliagarivorans marinus]|uniref:hypothetical protein n=1 Tax=Aliagarivorans marinus TaxID=561965 RepID=UPI00040967D6|nr:hypothetical protein [Aliagarivorans marinus]